MILLYIRRQKHYFGNTNPMKRFLFYLEILWIAAIVASAIVFAWNFYQQGSFNVSVYTPLITGGLSGIVLWNIRRQRKFYDTLASKKKLPSDEQL